MEQTRTRENTRDRLLNEGVAVLIEQGYHGTGLKGVLDRVRVPKGSFYNYFQSKEKFAAEIVRHYARGIHLQLDEALGNPKGDALAALRKYFKTAMKACEENRCGCLAGNLGAEIGSNSELCRSALADTLNGTQERLRVALEKAQAQGKVRNDLDAGDLAAFMLNAWEGALIRMKVEASVKPLRLFCTVMLDRFLKPSADGAGA